MARTPPFPFPHERTDDPADEEIVACVWGRSRRGPRARRTLVVAGVAVCLAVPGLVAGAPLGVLAGFLCTWLAGTGTAHGDRDLIVLFAFGPLGAMAGGLVLPVAYLVVLLHRRGCAVAVSPRGHAVRRG